MLFSTTCHPQTNGQIELVNHILSTMFRDILKKNLKMWEECSTHIEFSYKFSVHSTKKMCSSEIFYGFIPHAPIDLLSIPSFERVKFDARICSNLIFKMHKLIKENIKHLNNKYKLAGSHDRKHVVFEPGDLVWLHLRKDHFSDLHKSKLMPRANGPFKVLQRINDNAYKIDLPTKFRVSPTFNIAYLKPYLGEEEESPSKMTSIQEGGHDIMSSTVALIPAGLLTTARAKQLNC